MNKPTPKYVAHLPDLITAEDYAEAHRRTIVRVRLTVTDQGVEILGDSPYPGQLDDLLAALGPDVVEKVLCG